MDATCATRKVFYGVQATGRGHLSRFQTASSILKRAGHNVYGYASGKELPEYARGIALFEKGPTFNVRNNRIEPFSTFTYNMARLPQYYQSIRKLTTHLVHEQYDEAIVDFEPISARALTAAQVPITIFDNQSSCMLSLSELDSVQSELKMMCHFVRLYYGPAISAASRILTYSLIPAEPALEKQVVVPPCVRIEVADLRTSNGSHILYYSSIGSVPHELIKFAELHADIEVRAYVAIPPKLVGGLPANFRLPDRNASTFLQDLASCRLYVSGAGFESIAEAITLNKPMLVIPIEGQWEQRINAAIIEQYQIGTTAQPLTVEALEASYVAEMKPAIGIREWVSSGRAVLQDALLVGGSLPKY